MLGFLSFVIALAGAYAFWRQGVLEAFLMVVNVLLAGLIAFNFFEPLADQLGPMLADSFLHGYEDSLCLIALFSATLALLRWAVNSVAPTSIEYPVLLQQGGAAVFGLLAGYLVAGFLVCVAQTLPWDKHFLKFDARTEGSKLRRILPPDRVWLALMHRASETALAWQDDTSFDADGSFEYRYESERRQ